MKINVNKTFFNGVAIITVTSEGSLKDNRLSYVNTVYGVHEWHVSPNFGYDTKLGDAKDLLAQWAAEGYEVNVGGWLKADLKRCHRGM